MIQATHLSVLSFCRARGEDLDQARRDIADGSTTSGDDLRREFGLPTR